MAYTESAAILPPLALPARAAEWLDRVLIYGSVALIPYDLPVIHQACLPLAAIGVLLMVVRNDARQFLAFLRHFSLFSSLGLIICLGSILSLYGNLDEVLNSTFQQQSGWWRATQQMILLFANFFFPFYLAYCLRRHDDWKEMLVRAAWISLPIPLLVGLFQFANGFGVPGTAHLPYVQAYKRGETVFHITSVAREPSWFGSFTCIVIPFLIMSINRTKKRWLRWTGIAAVGFVLVFFFLGFSKSAYAGLAGEIALAVAVIFAIRRPWRGALKSFYWLLVLCTGFFAFSMAAPEQAGKITRPFVDEGAMVYGIFEPLIANDMKFIDLSTRFGMLDAGLSMAKDHPVIGVGLGQFGYHVYNYLPLWGFNRETASWVANDTGGWPSTSNLYGRLLAETGGLGTLAYLAFRLLIMLKMGIRLLHKSNPDWWFDLSVFSILAALFVFDFHRDSLINMDMWTAQGIALACLGRASSKEKVAPVRVGQILKFSSAVAALAFCASLLWIIFVPSAYQASATIIPKSGGVFVMPNGGGGPAVMQSGEAAPKARFALMRTFISSRTVGARMMVAHRALVQAVLGKAQVSPADVAQYIKTNVIILMADDQTTLTFEYWNPDPEIARGFLTATVEETDHAVTAASMVIGKQAAQLSAVVLQRAMDNSTRAALLNVIAAQELESSFANAGENANFDYVDRPFVSLSDPSPSPGKSIIFIFILAMFTASVAGVAWMLWPSLSQSFEWKSPRLFRDGGATM